MDQLRLAASAKTAGHVVKFLIPPIAQAGKNRLDTSSEQRTIMTGGKNRQSARSSAARTTRNRSVDELNIPPPHLSQPPIQLKDISRRDSRADDNRSVLFQRRHSACDGVEKEGGSLRVGRDHDDHDGDIFGRFPRRVGRGGAFGYEPEHGGLVDVIADYVEA